MYCKKCGKEISDDSNFCMECGTKFKEQSNKISFFSKYKKILLSLSIVLLLAVLTSGLFMFHVIPNSFGSQNYYSNLKGMGNNSYYDLVDQTKYVHYDTNGKQDETGSYVSNNNTITFTDTNNTPISYNSWGKYLFSQESFDGTVSKNAKLDQTYELISTYYATKVEYHSDGTFVRYTKNDSNGYQQNLTGTYKRDGDLIVHSVNDSKSFSYLVKDNKLYEEVYIKN